MTVYFVSGHCNLTEDEFNTYYKNKLDQAICESNENKFVIGNSEGADTMALEYLLERIYPHLITIYYKKSKNSKSIEYYLGLGVNLYEGFTSYSKRDGRLTEVSDIDIAWVRPTEETIELLKKNGEVYNKNRISGTELNLRRRENKNK
jgi:hypothetical protein